MDRYTFTLDKDTVAALERAAERLSRPKSQVVREAIRFYGEHVDRLSPEERDRMLAVFDQVTAALPDRPRSEVERELREIRRGRQTGGRASAGPSGGDAEAEG